MPLSDKAKSMIQALVNGGATVRGHCLEDKHFSEQSARAWSAADGKGVSFFCYNEHARDIHKTSEEKIAAPQTQLDDPEAFLSRQDRNFLKAKAAYRVKKNALREKVEQRLKSGVGENQAIDREALIKAFLLEKKSLLHSYHNGDRVEITGPVPWGFDAWYMPYADAPDDRVRRMRRMIVVLGGQSGSPQVISAHAIP